MKSLKGGILRTFLTCPVTMNNLFRDEVRAARAERWMGRVRVQPPRIGRISFALSLVMFLLIGSIVFFAHYTPREKAEGRVVPSLGLLNVPATSSGAITLVLVKEGDSVAVGQRLMEVSSATYVPGDDRGSIEDVLNDELVRQHAKLTSEISSLDAEQSIELQAAERQLTVVEDRIALTESQLRIKERQAERARSTFDKIRPLEHSQVVTALQFQQYESDSLEKGAAAEAVRQELFALRAQLKDVQSKAASISLDAGRKRDSLHRAISDLAQARLRNRVQKNIALVAPSAGRVVGMAVGPGQSVKEGQRLLSIIPEGSHLEVELWLGSRAAANVEPGDTVSLRFSGHPYQVYGIQNGHVVGLAESALEPVEIQLRSGIMVSEPSYRTLVALDEPGVARSAGGRSPIRLKPGMKVDADVKLARRRVIDLVLRDSGTHETAETKRL